jgi:hypothetical protein
MGIRQKTEAIKLLDSLDLLRIPRDDICILSGEVFERGRKLDDEVLKERLETIAERMRRWLKSYGETF